MIDFLASILSTGAVVPFLGALIDDVFSSAYLRAEDLPAGRPVWVEIECVEVRKFDDGPKVEIAFRGKKKRFLANMTNSRVIRDLYGGETDDWIGRKIALSATRVEFRGRMVPAIRVMTEGPPVKQEEKPVTPLADEDDCEELPFD